MVDYQEYVDLYNKLHPTRKDKAANPMLLEDSGLYWQLDYKVLRRQNLVQREGIIGG